MTIMAGALGLDGQRGWNYYNSGDAPEGAYIGWLPSGTDVIIATVKLPKQLSSGPHYIFFYGIDYDSKKTISASIGGATSTPITLDDRDATGPWSERAVLTVSSPSDTLEVRIRRNPLVQGDQTYLFKGLYITTNAVASVTRDSVAVNLSYPTTMDDSAPQKGNLIANGSFEVGVDAAWGFANNKNILPDTIWDTTQAYDGRASIKLPLDPSTNLYGPGTTLISRVYHLKPNKPYTLSMWVKTAPGLTVEVSISLVNTYSPPPGFGTQYSVSNRFTVTDTWKRISVSGRLLEYPSSDYQIYIDAGDSRDNFLWVDSIQLEEGGLTNFEPSHVVEAGIAISQSGHIFYADEPAVADFIVSNSSTSSMQKSLRYELYDYLNRVVRQDSVDLNVAAESAQMMSFDLSTNGILGAYRLVYWLDNEDGTEKEIVYSVIPRPATLGVDPSSSMGIHPNYLDSQLKTLQRLGIKWARVMSPSLFFRWSVVEPTENQYIWYDRELQLGASYGLTTMGTIGTNHYWPAWADNGGLPNLDKWEEFVGRLVAHYKPWVRHWEIWNEPDFPPDFYARMLKRAVDAIEANDPDAKIIGMGGVSATRIRSIVQSLETLYPTWNWKTHIDVLSTHDYPGGIGPETLSPVIEAYGLPVWNTESGVWDQGPYQGAYSNFVSWGQNLWPHLDARRYYNSMINAPDLLAKNFLRTIASGQTKYFYYDSRVYAAPNYFTGHPTIMEYDGAVRTKGISYAIAGSFIDHATGMGNVSSDPNSSVLLFDKAGSPVAALFSADNKNRQITISLKNSQFLLFDLMGNPIANIGSTIFYGRSPIYLRGVGVTTSTLKAALQSGVISNVADTTPPNISISDGPRGPISGTFRVRWIALDDSSLPNLGEINPESNTAIATPNPEAILYSYQLSGYSDWSAWTPTTYADFSNVPNGSFTFSVVARDTAGNQSVAVSRSVIVRR